VHCVVTSPPYWGLRDYGVPGQLGLEKNPTEYVAKMVAGFREVRRVLRSDGTLWLNLGDSYASTGGHADTACNDRRGQYNIGNRPEHDRRDFRVRGAGIIKPKDLVGMPWRLAFALQADGWYLRSDIIWSKSNPMPESVTDRPTKAHEYLFLLTKSAQYFYDAEAIKEETTGNTHERGNGVNPKCKSTGRNSRQCNDRDPAHLEAKRPKQNESFSGSVNQLVSSRNKRSVWEIATYAYPEAHFATFPPKLVEPCILAGTSEKGCCPRCFAPWERVVEPGSGQTRVPAGWDTRKGSHAELLGNYSEYNGKHRQQPERDVNRRILKNVKAAREDGGDHDNPFLPKVTTGWVPGCDCEQGPIPCTVLDPFSGAGTTGMVALRYHRNFIGIELKPKYVEMARKRIEQDAPLFNIQSAVTTV
jgi:DNA modification methylase